MSKFSLSIDGKNVEFLIKGKKHRFQLAYPATKIISLSITQLKKPKKVIKSKKTKGKK